MRASPRALRAHLGRRDALAAASAALERAFDAATGEAREHVSWFGRASEPDRLASLQAARVLAHGPSGSGHVARLRAALVREQRADGGFDARTPAAVSDAATTALAVEVLCAEHARSGGLENAITRASIRLAAGEVRPDVLRALVAACHSSAVRGALDLVKRAAGVLESDFDTQALQPLASTHEAADRLHAWHAAAAALGLDVRRHPAVVKCTMALIQRAEASAGELFAGYTQTGRPAGPRVDTHTAARAALALLAVHDVVVGPRAAFAAGFVLDALAAHGHAGALRARPSRFAPQSVTATASYVEALRVALARAAVPWTLPRAPAALLETASSNLARRA